MPVVPVVMVALGIFGIEIVPDPEAAVVSQKPLFIDIGSSVSFSPPSPTHPLTLKFNG